MNQTRIVSVPHELNYCRHGKEVRHITANESLGRWVVWGHYACEHCRTVAMDHFADLPEAVVVAGRRLAVHPREY
jgi:hypothetical protein